jgi:hypothetical protein
MSKKIILIFLVIVVLGAGYWFYNSEKTAEEPAGADDPENATYTISGQPVTLINGRADIEIVLGVATQEHVLLFGAPRYFDLDADGDLDAISFLQTDAGGSGTFYYVVAAINENGRYFGTNAMFLGDRIAPQIIDFLEGRAVANYADRNPGEPFTTPPSLGKSVWIHLDPNTGEIGEFVKDFEGESNLLR